MSDSRKDFDADRPVPAWDADAPARPKWESRGDATVYENPWLDLTRHPATAPTGADADYVVMRPRNMACGVLPIHSDGTVTLVGQARFPLMNYSWEMPEGGAPYAEDPLAGAKRELAEEGGEEAGLGWPRGRGARCCGWSCRTPSPTSGRSAGWRGICRRFRSRPIPTEVIALARVPFMALVTEIDRGAVRDALTVATTLRAYHMAKEGLLPGWLAHAILTRV